MIVDAFPGVTVQVIFLARVKFSILATGTCLIHGPPLLIRVAYV